MGSSGGRSLRAVKRLLGAATALLGAAVGGETQAASTGYAEWGRFYTQNHAPSDYGGHGQNWAVSQDHRGFIYVANGAGVLEFDGVSWRLIPTANRSMARSLAVDGEGRVFIGAVGDIGYLAPDEAGRLRHVSLRDRIPPEDRDFAEVWKTWAVGDAVYFQSYDRLFRWRDEQIRVWRPEVRFHSSHVARGRLYVHAWEGELLRMEDDVLVRAPGAVSFVGGRVYGLVAHGEDAFLAVTRARGVLRCGERLAPDSRCASFAPWLTETLVGMQPYNARALPDGGLAIGTIRAGLAMLDEDGRLLRVLDESSGLRGRAVISTFVDRQGGLWLGLDDGLSRVEIGSSITSFDRSAGLGAAVNSVARHRGRLYAATDLGVSVLQPGVDGAAARFVPVPGVGVQCWSLLSTEVGLLAGCWGGVYDLDTPRQVWPFRNRHVFALHRPSSGRDELYLGLHDGLARLRLSDGAWRDAGRVEGVREAVRSFAEDDRGRLWSGTPTNGILRLDLLEQPEDQPSIARFGVDDGLPQGWLHARTLMGRAVFLSDIGLGLFRMDEESGAFVADQTLADLLPEGMADINDIHEDASGRIWISAGADSGVADPQPGGGYTFTPTALRRGSVRDAYVTYAEPSGAVWIGGSHGLIRLGWTGTATLSGGSAVWVRRVTSSGGALYDGEPAVIATEPDWPYENNDLRFEFAAARFAAPERNLFRTRLDGYDEEWSEWSTETDREYTNLREGRYVFRVQARDVLGSASGERAFAFGIRPPWYRAWWAWSLYLLTAGGSIWAGDSLRTRSLRRRNLLLRREIDRRHEAERLLEVQKAELELKNQELERFAYTVSHDLKTPLVTIKGFAGLVEKDLDGGSEERARRDIEVISSAADEMQRLLQDLLELARVGLVIEPSEVAALGDLAREAALRLEEQLRARGVELEIQEPMPRVPCDRRRLQEVFHNLIENAVKFMDDQPRPRIEIGARQGHDSVVCWVRDNGRGVAPAYREKVFDLFSRLDPAVDGTGVGLTLVRRIVEAHGGRVWVESAGLGRGSTFSFSLSLRVP